MTFRVSISGRRGTKQSLMWACKRVVTRGFSNALLAAPLRSVANSLSGGRVGQDALALATAGFPFLRGLSWSRACWGPQSQLPAHTSGPLVPSASGDALR